ncbi:hypothetical protein FOG51_01531 [Hanseniaspora uvarum]|nr:hypothetical protein FOG48_01778 [Hanseniaspora uvarum]KAF0273495.1 hypothetical protein FOG51_01531 [Hanseniaspora uvarum]KAF0276914.1 hypothetical protein FOG50_02213 [Hanseniaspora uvarum]KKA02676.1 Altered inheritance of mitochondria protein 46, mitochondrial [Hanseniaspora uvarum DSM 2768]
MFNKAFRPKGLLFPIRNFKLVATIGGFSAANIYYFNSFNKIENSTSPINEKTVKIDKKIKDIETKYTFNKESQWSLLGYGVRAVTFMKFRIYALSIYSNSESINKIDDFFTRNSIKQIDFDEELCVDMLERENIEFMARITPLRDTTYEHLREGLIRSAMSSKEAKMEPAAMVDAVNTFRSDGMKRNGSVLINDDLFIFKNKDNTLTLFHCDYKTNQYTKIGDCSHKLFAVALFSKYLNYDAPLTKEAQKRFSNYFNL